MYHKLIFLSILFLLNCSISTSYPIQQLLIQCLTYNNNVPVSTIYTPKNSSFAQILESRAQNPRFAEPTVPKSELIITPLSESQVQAVVICSKKYGVDMRVRSGGHDFEGVSYVSFIEKPFIILDLTNFRSVDVNVKDNSAWVQVGATLGEVYYRIAEQSDVHGFSAGICSTVGVGGHITGGGYGAMMRKFGLAADNIIDAQIVDANGRLLNRDSMGEDLFWAIRGGGGGSFGVILSWKIKLVPVPKTVTVFSITKPFGPTDTKLMYRWQQVAHNLDKDLMVRILLQTMTTNNTRAVFGIYVGLFLGSADRLMQVVQHSFPELGLTKKDCIETSWVRAMVHSYLVQADMTPEILLQRNTSTMSFKGKADFVREPIPEFAIKELLRRMVEDDGPLVVWTPYGGRMDEIPEDETPFPHRNGTLFKFHYFVFWQEGDKNVERHLNWIRSLYSYMTPYVSKYPREAYVNYRDLDLGVNKKGNTSVVEASAWGVKYFKGNFKKLVKVKTQVDPSNFFRHEQSIPLLTPKM